MRTTTGTSTSLDVPAFLGAVAGTLSDAGQDALADVLDRAVRTLDLRSAVLRDAGDGALRAVAGDVVHAVPRERAAGPEPVVELPVHAGAVRVATLTVVGARPSHLPVLRAFSSVLGLALAPRVPGPAGVLPLALLAAADADADDAADALHDGPVQELVFARFAADAAVRGGDAASARDAVQSALQSMRRALWLLRPRGAGEGLAAGLEQLSARLAEVGPGLDLDLDAAACAALPPQAASVGYRLVQALARAADAPVAVAVHRTGTSVRVMADSAAALPAPDRWSARARALGGVLTVDPPARVVLTIPIGPRTVPPDEIEATP